MKTSNNYKMILSMIVFFLMSACVYAYPPDNAAVLYYKAAMLYAPDDKMEKVLSDFSNEAADFSKADVDRIRKFVNKNRSIIDTVLDAAEIKNCDWGLDYSEGLAMEIPLGSQRKLACLVLADAKILAMDGNYETALNRCMSLYKIARHMNDRVFVAYLMGAGVNGRTNSCVMQIMSDMPQDMQNLSRLKNRLAKVDSISFSVKPAIIAERDAMLIFMTPQRISDGVTILRREDVPLSEEHKAVYEKILSFDDVMIERNRKYFENFYTGVVDVFEMPYPQGYASLAELCEKAGKEMIEGNPDATLTVVFRPAMGKIFSLATHSQTHDNAIRTAIELYMIKAQKGKLPDKLPADLPADCFSGKPFDYEKTADGFILRCQGKEINTGKVYQYEFKVK